MRLSVTSLLSAFESGAETILRKALEVAKALELPVTSWRAGDPTRSLYHLIATLLETYESTSSGFAKSAFLSTAEDDWLEVLAYEVHSTTKRAADYATPTVVVRNSGGGVFDFAEGQLSFKSTVNGRTYHNTTAAPMNPGDTVSFDCVADDAGTDSNVAINEIDTIVTGQLGLVIVSSTAATGSDAESNPELRVRARSAASAFTPASPADAYEYVATTPELTGITSINRAKAYGSDDGTVALYVATRAGAASGGEVAAVQAAIIKYATPLTARPTTASAAALAVPVTITIKRAGGFSDSLATITANLSKVFSALFASISIGNEGEDVANSVLVSTVHDTYPGMLLSVSATTGVEPDGTERTSITLSENQIPTLLSLVVTEAA